MTKSRSRFVGGDPVWYNRFSILFHRETPNLRKLIVVVVFLFLTLVAFAGEEKLSPILRQILARAESENATDLSFYAPSMAVFNSKGLIRFPILPGEESGDRVGVLVKVIHPFWGSSFLGFPVAVSTGTILGMRVTLAELLALIASPDVIYVEPSWKTEPKLDMSLPSIGIDRVHAHAPPILGENVIIGAVDTGIDYMHLDFRYDADGDGIEESSRIASIWDQAGSFFGTTYSNGDIESDLALGLGPNEGIVRQTDSDGHGTHVMGIAAGDGTSSTGFIGVSPEAQIIMVKTTFYTMDILDGVEYVFEQAEERGFPAVVNLSLGGHDGPHDGTSLFEQGLDELLQESGRAIVVSAGNEGDQSIHISHTLHGDSFTFLLDPSSDSIDLSLWYPGGSAFTITVTPPGGSPLVVPARTTVHASTASGLVAVDNALAGANPNNGDNEALISLSSLMTSTAWSVTVSDAGGGGRFDGWIISNRGAILGGDSNETIDEPGNAERVITVGAFNTKAIWPSLSGEQDFSDSYPIGDLAVFSSRGPTRDGRQKPELTAPGAWICSTLSADSPSALWLTHPDGVHTMNLGTSMAAPHVSGVIALMLAVNPQLTAAQIKETLIETAVRDSFAGSVPNPRWGWGKVAAEAAVAAVETHQPPEPEERPTVTLEENPVYNLAAFSYTLPEGTGQAKLAVLNVAGALIFDTILDPSQTSYRWNLVANFGEPLASGLYLYVIVTDTGRSEIGRMVIER
jgi:subtilisin family serine protease